MKTKDEVISGRLCGLKMFDKAVAKAGREAIIAEGIKIHNSPAYKGIWGPSDCWSHFNWAFGNAWRHALNANKDISATANLDEMLMQDEIEQVRVKTGITEPLDFGNPRKGGFTTRDCPRHT